ncbi:MULTISPECIES: ribokinase [Sulfitobacter]|jgi:ribokinase|uniref:Ribokinase n=1 Tax=Sulfitobacter pontiacus TaxID=60137 RepID=A0AAX3A7U4_9RHOB|nr:MULTISPECIES: ribokinase [Sulfitobacter]HBU54527.1 ribokinase [Sulfitobacter sp.]EAP85734.1 ribokinase [Sulfitobacter sp. EE-36]OAN74159.1 ribokinase [Sulfitobacter pontiacus]UOA22012.1 Ribokinase [Sulfitobacter pontiacus]WPZ25788.1 ribokinase [Sulfitobacter pontiacus]|tara:strand:- start:922 stop:1800 length:879 start_codon:yes stop_codon:yes gene_type:complete
MIWNLGSINADNFYYLRHLPAPGETIAAHDFRQGLGGKGANMSVAAARAGTRVMHIGAVGPDGKWTVDRLLEYGVETQHISMIDTATGHANICVAEDGENSIVLFSGANHQITTQMIGAALAEASPGDFLLMQNETLGQRFAAQTAHTLGLRVAYAAAPFDAEIVAQVLPDIDLLVLNEVEAEALEKTTGARIDALPIDDIIVTLGAEGCKWVSNKAKTVQSFPAYPVKAIDTTGAGDTFTGYLIAALDRKLSMPDAIALAMQAGALMVTRQGTADVIPDLKDIQDHGFDED